MTELQRFISGTPMSYLGHDGTRYVATFHAETPPFMDVRRSDGRMFKTPYSKSGETAVRWRPIMSRIDAENCFNSTFGDSKAAAKLLDSGH